jgi:Histone deacetylase domain
MARRCSWCATVIELAGAFARVWVCFAAVVCWHAHIVTPLRCGMLVARTHAHSHTHTPTHYTHTHARVQGDGTASIFAGDASVHTTSFHCGANFPFRKVPSDLDISLPAGMRDAEFLRIFREAVSRLLWEVQPELVLYDAGVDMWEGDALGKLLLSEQVSGSVCVQSSTAYVGVCMCACACV